MGKKNNNHPVGRNSKPVPGNPTRNGRFTFDEFKDAISSDASKENESLKIKISKMKKEHLKEIERLNKELEQYKQWNDALTNRCYAITNGLICSRCTIPSCKHNFYFQHNIEINDFIDKEKIDFTKPKDVDKFNEFLEKILKNIQEEQEDGK